MPPRHAPSALALMLKIHNSLARQKQDFVPIEPGKVRMYVCGMTVYDYCHIGHARVMVVFDIVRRWLRASGFAVIYVRNITDIEDKIIKRAAENGESISDLTARFIQFMNEDAAALGVEKPDVEPRATAAHPRHAEAHRHADAERALPTAPTTATCTSRCASSPATASCRASRSRTCEPVSASRWNWPSATRWTLFCGRPPSPATQSWDSPWGPGRPGWHIECSAMSEQFLGEHFDIHGGGQDLVFPHHENEIAQSEGAHGHTFVNYWVHNGFVRVDNEKMSKSLGNFFTVREVLAKYDPEVVRFFIARAHYRSPLNYSDQHLDDARAGLARLYTTLRDTPPASAAVDWSNPHAARFREAMNDDFNTAEATAVLFELASEVNRSRSVADAGLLQALAGLLGLLQREPSAFLQGGASASELPAGRIDALIVARAAARKAKNFAEADRIRKELEDAGVVLEDSAKGTLWRRS